MVKDCNTAKKQRNCIICNSIFISTVHNKKTCSSNCYRLHSNAYNRNYKKHHGWHKNPITKQCVVCNATYQSTSPTRLTCSKECLNIYRKDYFKKIRDTAKEKTENICKFCGKILQKPNKFCSDLCFKTYKNTKYDKECTICGVNYITLVKNKNTCCKCNPNRRRKKIPERRYCSICGTEFYSTVHGKQTCSDKCSYEKSKRRSAIWMREHWKSLPSCNKGKNS